MTPIPSEIPESGVVEELPLPRLLIRIHRARWTGRVELRHGRGEKSFEFQRGAPVMAESNLSGEALGACLVDEGRIRRPELARVESCMAQ